MPPVPPGRERLISLTQYLRHRKGVNLATTLQKRVARELEKLEAAVADEEIELNEHGKVDADDVESFESIAADLRERGSAPRLTADARRAVTELARRKLNKSLVAD